MIFLTIQILSRRLKSELCFTSKCFFLQVICRSQHLGSPLSLKCWTRPRLIHYSCSRSFSIFPYSIILGLPLFLNCLTRVPATFGSLVLLPLIFRITSFHCFRFPAVFEVFDEGAGDVWFRLTRAAEEQVEVEERIRREMKHLLVVD